MKIAIIGTGISGMVAAHHLHGEHDITVYEAAARLGGHTHTVRVEDEGGRRGRGAKGGNGPGEQWIDTGFIVFNDRNYPNFEALLGELGVASQPSHMSFSVADGEGGFEYSGTPWGLFARPSHLVSRSFLAMLREWVRFNREARALIGAGANAPSLGVWLEQGGYSRDFIERLIVPQASAVWSADPAQMWSFPASFMAEFFENHGMYSLRNRPHWRTVAGGSRSYVEAISAPWRDRVRLGAPVRRIERTADGVRVTAEGCETESFDRVVVASHSDQALAMLGPGATPAEREVLSAVPYQRNEAILHTDAALMPRRRAAWSSWNFHLTERPSAATTVTYWMNNLQRLKSKQNFFLTLNRSEEIDPAKVLHRQEYDHPVYTAEGIAAQARHGEINGADRVHFAGAYWGWGFHEDGVVSALRAIEGLASGVEIRPPYGTPGAAAQSALPAGPPPRLAGEPEEEALAA